MDGGTEQFHVGELLIQNLDDNGFHLEDPETLVKGDEERHLEAMKELIQGFDPVGTCTANYRESLIVQTTLNPAAPEYTAEILSDYLDLLEKSKFAEIARKLKISQELSAHLHVIVLTRMYKYEVRLLLQRPD